MAGTFFAQRAGWVMTGLYFGGVAAAVVTARLMRRFVFPVDETPFVMELPPYRLPTWKTTLSHMWDKCAQYLRKMGGMILVASVVVWFLSYYPRTEGVQGAAHYETSYLGRIGKACGPVFRPLGLDWKAGVALLSGLPAKEIVVSTLGVLYAAPAGESAVPTADAPAGCDTGTSGLSEAPGDGSVVRSEAPAPAVIPAEPDGESAGLAARLRASGDFTTASALAFLVFILLYIPCIATVAAIGAEAGWRWAAIAVVYDTALAWGAAWVVYRLALWFC